VHRSLVRYFYDPDYTSASAANDIPTLSLHDALPISARRRKAGPAVPNSASRSPTATPIPRASSASSTSTTATSATSWASAPPARSEEHTSELQSRENLVCRLLLEKKKKYQKSYINYI